MSSKERGHRSSGSAEKRTKAHRAAKRAPPSEAQKPVDAPPAKPREPEPEDLDEATTPAPEPVKEPETPSFSPSSEPAPASPTPVGAPMPTEPTPAPAPVTTTPAPSPPPAAPTPQWEPVAEPAAPEGGVASDADAWETRVTSRRGHPVPQAAGWAIVVLGLLLLVAAYYRGYQTRALPAPSGIRLDYVAGALLVVGLILAVVFAFVPARLRTGIQFDASADDLRARASRAHQRVRTAQVLVGVGLGILIIGMVWLLYWVRQAFLGGALLRSNVGNYSVPTHYFGAILVLLGLLIAVAFWARVGPARAERAYAVLALKRAAAPAAAAAPLGGVTEAEVQALMRRLDGLMAQLPDAAVTEFSKTPEADTYLKLLGS